jgi:hypothetical protein
MLWRRGKAYAQDLRERVFASADEGMPVGQIAVQLRVIPTAPSDDRFLRWNLQE